MTFSGVKRYVEKTPRPWHRQAGSILHHFLIVLSYPDSMEKNGWQVVDLLNFEVVWVAVFDLAHSP